MNLYITSGEENSSRLETHVHFYLAWSGCKTNVFVYRVYLQQLLILVTRNEVKINVVSGFRLERFPFWIVWQNIEKGKGKG